MSGLLLTRLVHSVYSALTGRFPISKFPCLTDSATTLASIENEIKHYKQSAQNQFTEVRELIKTDMWYYLPGKKILQICHQENVWQKNYHQRVAIG